MFPDGDAKNCTFGVSHQVQGRGSAVAGGAEIIAGKAIPVAVPTIAIAALSSIFLNCLPLRLSNSKQAANDRMLTLRSGFLIEIGRPTLRVHDLRHTYASLAQFADILALARPRLWRWKALDTRRRPRFADDE